MSESEFLSGNIANNHLPFASPSMVEAAAGGKGPTPDPERRPCDTFMTIACGFTAIPGPCDPAWLKNKRPPDDFVKKHGPPPYQRKPPIKK